MPFQQGKKVTTLHQEAMPTFEDIYVEFNSYVRNLVWRIAGNQKLDDLNQEIFFKIWQNLTRFDHRSSLKTWIYRIAVNTTIDHLRRTKEEVSYDPDHHFAQPSTVERIEQQQIVIQLFKSLNHDERILLTLADMEGFTIAEIAEVLSIPQGTVKSRLHKTRNVARKFLSELGVEV